MAAVDPAAPQLVLGPLLRYIGETEATIWVQTDRACLVEILGRQARTFQVPASLRPGGDRQPQSGY